MTRSQWFLLFTAAALFAFSKQPAAPLPPAHELEPLVGLGAFSVDLPDDQLAALGHLMTGRTVAANGWDITLADDCVMRFDRNKVFIDGGVAVRGRVWGVPVGTTIKSLAWDTGRVVIDLNGVPVDVVLK